MSAWAFVTFVFVPVTCGKYGGPFVTYVTLFPGRTPLLVEDGGNLVEDGGCPVANSSRRFLKRYTAKIK